MDWWETPLIISLLITILEMGFPMQVKHLVGILAISLCLPNIFIVIRYKVYSQQHARAGTNIQHVIYDQLARAGQNM